MRTSLVAMTVAAAALAAPAAAEYHAGAGAAEWVGTGATGHTYCLEAIQVELAGQGDSWTLTVSGQGVRVGGDALQAFRCAIGPRYEVTATGTPETTLRGTGFESGCTVRVSLDRLDAATTSVYAEELCASGTWTLYGRASLTRI